MRRREFIAFVGSTAVARPFAAQAQQGNQVQPGGMLIGFNDPDTKIFQQELERLGWSEGRNIQIDYRYAPAGARRRPALAACSK